MPSYSTFANKFLKIQNQYITGNRTCSLPEIKIRDLSNLQKKYIHIFRKIQKPRDLH